MAGITSLLRHPVPLAHPPPPPHHHHRPFPASAFRSTRIHAHSRSCGNVTFPGQGTGWEDINRSATSDFWTRHAERAVATKAHLIIRFNPSAFNPDQFMPGRYDKALIVNGLDPETNTQRNQVFETMWAVTSTKAALTIVHGVVGQHHVDNANEPDAKTVLKGTSRKTYGRQYWAVEFHEGSLRREEEDIAKKTKKNGRDRVEGDLDSEKETAGGATRHRRQTQDRGEETVVPEDGGAAMEREGSLGDTTRDLSSQIKVFACPIWSPKPFGPFTTHPPTFNPNDSNLAGLFVITVTVLLRTKRCNFSSHWQSYVHVCTGRELATEAWVQSIRLHGDKYFKPEGEICRPFSAEPGHWPPRGRLDLYWEGKTVDYEAIFICATSMCFETEPYRIRATTERAIDAKQRQQCGYIGPDPNEYASLGNGSHAYNQQNVRCWELFRDGPRRERQAWDERRQEEKRLQQNALRRERRRAAADDTEKALMTLKPASRLQRTTHVQQPKEEEVQCQFGRGGGGSWSSNSTLTSLGETPPKSESFDDIDTEVSVEPASEYDNTLEDNETLGGDSSAAEEEYCVSNDTCPMHVKREDEKSEEETEEKADTPRVKVLDERRSKASWMFGTPNEKLGQSTTPPQHQDEDYDEWTSISEQYGMRKPRHPLDNTDVVPERRAAARARHKMRASLNLEDGVSLTKIEGVAQRCQSERAHEKMRDLLSRSMRDERLKRQIPLEDHLPLNYEPARDLSSDARPRRVSSVQQSSSSFVSSGVVHPTSGAERRRQRAGWNLEMEQYSNGV